MQEFEPLTYGQIRMNKAAVDGLTAKDLDLNARVEAAVTFLLVAQPNLNVDVETPIDLMTAAADLYLATFTRPEAPGPVPQNP